MRLIKVGLANIDTTVGAFDSNIKNVLAYAHQMANEECTIGVFQEQVIGGYAAEDLVHFDRFVEAQWEKLLWFTDKTADLPFQTTFVLGLTVADGGNLYNCAAVVFDGKILGIVPKEKLPTYGVFYENRTLSHGLPNTYRRISKLEIPFGDLIFDLPFGKLGVEVCEDIWSPNGPLRRRANSGAEIIVNISSSPFRSGVVGTRREMISTRAGDNEVTLVYVNQIGGQDSLVYDGGGFVNQNGRMLLEAPRWREGISTQVVDLDRTVRLRRQNTTWRRDQEIFLLNETPSITLDCRGLKLLPQKPNYKYPIPTKRSFFIPSDEKPKSPREEYFDDLIEAMIWGLKGYFEKSGAFEKIGIALSGGKDSALVLLITYLYSMDHRFKFLEGGKLEEAIKDFIYCYSMPSRFNSETTMSIARELAEELGVTFVEYPIEDAFEREVNAGSKMLPDDITLGRETEKNIQARLRGLRMWSMSNALKFLWIQTSNMSEKAVGYTTIGGDMMGGFSLIANLPKSVIIPLLAYLGEKYQIKTVVKLLETEASAELAFGQEDEKDLMPFDVLDALLYLYAGENLMPDELFEVVRSMWTDEEFRAMEASFEPEMLKIWVKRFVRLFQNSIFKWVQTPQGVHLGSLDLDRERALQLPVIQSKEWLEESLQKINEVKES